MVDAVARSRRVRVTLLRRSKRTRTASLRVAMPQALRCASGVASFEVRLR
ncbi:hypothetical protein [Nostoc sp.]